MGNFDIPLANRRGTPQGEATSPLGQAQSVLSVISSLAGTSTSLPFVERLMTFAGISNNPNQPVESQVQQFTFQINPQRLRRSRRKIQSSIFLGKEPAQAANPFASSYDYHYQNLQFENFQYDGVTPAFSPMATQNVPMGGTSEEQWQDYTVSPGWQWFLQFRDFFDEFADTMIVMKYLNAFYVGVLDDLRFTRDAQAPFNIAYSFTFRSFFDYELLISVTPLDMVFNPDAGGINPSTARARGELIRRFIVRPLNPELNPVSQAPVHEIPATSRITFVDYLAITERDKGGRRG